MNLSNYLEYCMNVYPIELEKTENGIKLGDVVIRENNEKPEIGIVVQISKNFGELRTDDFGMTSTEQVRLASDQEIQMYRPNILKENWNKEKNQLITLVQDWGDGINKISITSTIERMKSAIKYVTHWRTGEPIDRINALGTVERDNYIKKICTYFRNAKGFYIENTTSINNN